LNCAWGAACFQTTCVCYPEGEVAKLGYSFSEVASYVPIWSVADDGVASADEAVVKSGFADVGSADNGHLVFWEGRMEVRIGVDLD